MAYITTYPPGDTINGTSESDVIETLYHNNMPHRYIYGRGGDDSITVNSWHFSRYHPLYWQSSEKGDGIYGGSGSDTIYGNDGGNNIYGDSGNDVINGGTPEYDPIFGQDDIDDIIYADAGRDTLDGQGGHDYIYGGSSADYIKGGNDNDSLYGGKGHDIILGEAGNDIINGGADKDTLAGGDGSDRFVFLAVSETGITAKTRDVITDFEVMIDIIDLSGIDANILIDGNQSFKFIGNSAFTRAAGELRFNNGFAFGDIDADGRADFKIEVTGTNNISGGDFIL